MDALYLIWYGEYIYMCNFFIGLHEIWYETFTPEVVGQI
jgi:hypothetical protein